MLLPSLNNGGMERVAAALSTEFSKNYDLSTISLYPSKNDFGIQGKIYCIDIPLQNSLLKKVEMTAARILKYRALKQRIQPDVVLSFGEIANFVSILSGGFERKIITVHSIKSVENLPEGFKGQLTDAFMKVLYRQQKNIVCVSQSSKDDLIASYHISTENIEVIPNPNDIHKIQCLSEESIDDFPSSNGKICLISIGRLITIKAFHRIIRVVSELEKENPGKFQLLIIGDGPERSNLEQLVREKRLEKVVFLMGQKRNPFPYLRKSDLFVLTSDVEGFGMVLVESLTCGVPVISTDCVSAVRDILQISSDSDVGAGGVVIPMFNQDLEYTKDLNPIELLLKNRILEISQGMYGRFPHLRENIERFSASEVSKKYMRIVDAL